MHVARATSLLQGAGEGVVGRRGDNEFRSTKREMCIVFVYDDDTGFATSW